MDYQVLFNIAVLVAGFFGGWTLNNITKAIERLDNDVRQLPQQYVPKEDFYRGIDELKEICGKIFDRLESKADK